MAVYMVLGVVIMMLLVAANREYTPEQKGVGLGVLMLVFIWPFLLFIKVLSEILLALCLVKEKKNDS